MSHCNRWINTFLIVVFTALLIPGLASAAAQATMKFTFDVTFNDGPLDGDTFTGSFTLNGFTGSGLEVFLPPGSSEPGGTGKLLAFEIEVDGNVFTMSDDTEFRDLPMIEAEEGMISYMDYGGVSNTGVRLRLDGSPGIEEPSIVWYEDDSGTKSFGYWNNVQIIPYNANARSIDLTYIAGQGANPVPKGHALFVETAFGVEMFLNIQHTRCLPGGEDFYGIYIWTSAGRTRLDSFNTSCAAGSFYTAPQPVAPAMLTDDICIEIWQDKDDGFEAPDYYPNSGFPVLRGEDEAGSSCTNLK